LNLQQTSITDIRSFNLQEELTPISISGTASPTAPVPSSNEHAATEPSPVRSTNNAEITSLNNLRQLMLATLMYVQDHNDVFPPMVNYNGLKASLMKYVKYDNIFYMPENHTPYAFNPLLNKHPMRTISKPAKLVVYYEPSDGADGRRGAAFADGHVSRLSPSEWEMAKKASRLNR
jgi:prepilin-type processing-associated H-X9-DG protein